MIDYFYSFVDKTMYCHYIGSIVSFLTYYVFCKNNLQVIAYFNTPRCYISYWVGFSYGIWKKML